MRRAARLALACTALGSLAGCGTHGLSFRLDERVSLVSPSNHAKVDLPLSVRWTADDFSTTDGASFGVLVDRTPPPPGKTLAWLFRNDDSCGETGCEDTAYREQRGVFQTRTTEVVLEEVATIGERNDGDGHEVTVILLDAQGRRVGEGAWSRQFRVERVS